jgi:F-type H+-transporting ATPase subunit b
LKRVALLALFAIFSFAAFSQDYPEATHASTESHKEEPDNTGWKWANFALLVGAFGYFLAKKGPQFFNARSKEILIGIDEAARMRADAEARAAEIDRRLDNLASEIDALRESAKAEAATEGDRVRQQTERDIAKVQANAEQEIASALKSAQAELRRHSAGLAMELAQQKVRDRITPADQDHLLGAFVLQVRKEIKPAR